MLSITVSPMQSCGIWNERQMPRLRDRARGEPDDVAAVELDLAAVGLEVAGDHVDEGRLAGAVAPIRLTLSPAGTSIVTDGGGDDRAEALVEAAGREHGLHSAAPLGARRRPAPRRGRPAGGGAPKASRCRAAGTGS